MITKTDFDLSGYSLKLGGSTLIGTIGKPASLKEIYLSKVALVVHLEINMGKYARQELKPLHSQVRVLMRLALDRLRKNGVDCPGVALISPEGAGANWSDDDAASFRKLYGPLASDQDWHRGEFLVFVEASSGEANARLGDLLKPEPPMIGLTRSRQSMGTIIQQCTKHANWDKNELLRELVNGWKLGEDKSGESPAIETQRTHLITSGGSEALNKVRKIYFSRADELLEEFRL